MLSSHLVRTRNNIRPPLPPLQIIESKEEVIGFESNTPLHYLTLAFYLFIRSSALTIMIIHNRPLTLRIQHNTLSTGRIYIPMARQYRRPATLRETIPSIAVEIRPSDVFGAADYDVVFITGWREFEISSTALPHAEENVEELFILVHDRALLDRKVRCVVRNDGPDILLVAAPCE